ncbi:hypothetical protein N9W57_03660 [Pseudomonadales bacterium]|nr:hypothetical protein [Pseudomonadales bacterium]
MINIRMFFSVITLLVGSFQVNVFAQNLSPGALEPERELPMLPDIVDDNIVTVPSVAARPDSDDNGPVISVQKFVITYDEPQLVSSELSASATSLVSDYLQDSGNALSLTQLDDVAFLLTEQLRGSGLLLAKAIVPAQEIESGAVLIRVFVGKFGAVDSEANVLYNKTTIQQPFESAIGDAVKVDFVESTILRLSDMPGFTAAAVFKPGNALGETRLTVKAVEEAPVSYFAQADNLGVESTGDARLLLGVKVNNVTGHIDQLSVDALKTFSPGDLRNARLAYEITHPDLVHTLGLGFSKTSYDVEDEAVLVLGIEGDTEMGEIFLRSQWVRQRNINLATRIGLALKRSNVDFTTFNVEQGVDRLTVFEATVVADALDTRFRGVHRASLTFSHGFNGLLGSMDGQGNGESLGIVNGEQTLPGQFNKISASYSRLQSVVRNNSLLFHFNGQYSDDLLSSLERMSLGGPYTVRAYPVAEYVRDTAVFTSLAWVINGGVFSDGIAYGEYGWSDILSLSLFADYGWGKLKDGSGGPTSTIDIAGWGVEAELTFPDFGGFTRLSAAKPFDGSEALNGEDIQYWLSFGLNL